MTAIVTAILAIKADAQVSVNAEDIDQITWHDDNPTSITNADILAKQTELQTEYDNLVYVRNRKAEYPSIEECVHAILDDDLENLQILRQAVKEKYPK